MSSFHCVLAIVIYLMLTSIGVSIAAINDWPYSILSIKSLSTDLSSLMEVSSGSPN